MGTTTGQAPPLVWTRREIARAWGIPPPDVDRYPRREVHLEIRLSNIEAEVAAWTPR